MKRGCLFVTLAFVVSLLLPWAIAYSSYDAVTEADFFTKGVKYEAVDIENLYADKQNVIAIIAAPFLPLFFLGDNFFGLFLHFSRPIDALPQIFSFLRC